MHVLPFVDQQGTFGGPVAVALEQAEGLRRAGHEVEIVAYSSDGPTAVTGVRTFAGRANKSAGPGVLTFSLALLRYVRSQRKALDVLHLHTGRHVLPLLAMAVVLGPRGPRIFLQSHGMLLPRASVWTKLFDYMLLRPSLYFVTSVLVLTRAEGESLHRQFGARNTTELPNGVKSYLAPDGDLTRPLPDGPVRVLYAGRLHERKRPVMLALALERLASGDHPYEATFIGPDEGQLQPLLAILGRLDHATYAGAQSRTEVLDAMRRSDIFVLPSLAEPYPMAVLEALSAACAVVITDDCGLAPLLRKARAALVTGPSEDALVAALGRLIADRDLQFSLQSAARQLVQGALSIDTLIQRLSAAYASD